MQNNRNLKIEMKIYNTLQFEKLNIDQIQLKDLENLYVIEYHYFPKNKNELKEIIKQRIEGFGVNCDLNDIDVSRVTDMSYLFYKSDFNGNISKWNVSKVNYMYSMFEKAKNFNGNISTWNVSNVKNMNCMFNAAINFNQDISKWDVSNVTDMYSMFEKAKNFNGNISTWNVSNVEDMSYMFYGATSFYQDLSSWNVENVIDYQKIFSNCPIQDDLKKQPKFKD